MRPEIEAYLREHGARYTTEALRRQLIAAGYDPADVDTALRESEAARASSVAEIRSLRARFWRWAIGLHVAALLVATVWMLLGQTSPGYVGLAALVLGFALFIGLWISGTIGRALVGKGLAVALVVPLISALLLGGTCMSMAGPVRI
jgi:hypothetical protein